MTMSEYFASFNANVENVLQPYRFKPVRLNLIEDNNSENEVMLELLVIADEVHEQRLNGNDWCLCECCAVMTSN
jgi:hypothetical protein